MASQKFQESWLEFSHAMVDATTDAATTNIKQDLNNIIKAAVKEGFKEIRTELDKMNMKLDRIQNSVDKLTKEFHESRKGRVTSNELLERKRPSTRSTSCSSTSRRRSRSTTNPAE